MTSFGVAVERKQWQIVTYRLLLAISETAHKLPPESLDALLDLLGSERKPEGCRDR
jgi:hypothetical protein